MNSKRVYIGMIILVSLLGSGIIAMAILGNSILQKQSNKLVSLKLDNEVLNEQQTSITQAKKDVEKYSELNKEAKAIVPQDKDQAAAVREITKIASESGIKLSSISFPASSLGQKVAAPASTDKTEGSDSTKKETGPPVTQVKAVEGIKGVYSMEITILQDSNNPVSYSGLINFLDKLEQNRRTAQVTSVTIQPIAKSPDKLAFTLVLSTYIKP